MSKILVTGGAGFIGSNFILFQKRNNDQQILNLDCLSYASNLKSLESIAHDPGYSFVAGGIGDREILGRIFDE
ncbi:MAG: GDP-mannose 4,6-dehydratase, partial [Syntrophobacteraceae bacterium]